MTGKVHLVGCGPGSPDHMTVRAVKTLEKADVVIYDRLLNPSILTHAGNAEKIYCGKQPGESSKQDWINRTLYEKARDGKRVVRLKNGNPFVFGRGGEELEYLRNRGIRVEIVPGMTSAISIPSLNNIPLTKRGVSSSLTILSARGAEGTEPHWEGIGDTTVVLMPISNLPLIVKKLVNHGKEENSLCALIRSETTKRDRLLVSHLSRVVEIAKISKIEPPSLFLVGEVIREALDVRGRTFSSFRPKHAVKRTESLIKKAGGIPKIFEICEIKPSNNLELKKELSKNWDYLVFMSPAGVESANQFTSLLNKKAIAVGDRTAEALKKHGCKNVLVPKHQSSKGVEEVLREKGGKALALRSPLAENKLEGAKNVEAYTVIKKDISRTVDEYLTEIPDFTLLTSVGMVRLLLESVEEDERRGDLANGMNNSFVLSLGRNCTEFALSQDIEINYEFIKPNLESFLLKSRGSKAN